MKAFLIPGNKEDLDSRDYQDVLDIYGWLGYEPRFVPIRYRWRSITKWVDQVLDDLDEDEISKSLLSGFSFGSMIAIGVAAKINPAKLALYSISPYFKENQPFPEKYNKWHSKRVLTDFGKFSLSALGKAINCPTEIFVGSKEKDKYPRTWQVAQQANKSIKNSNLTVIEGAGHDVGDTKYGEAIYFALK